MCRCGHCKQLEPEYKAAAKKLKKHVRLALRRSCSSCKLSQHSHEAHVYVLLTIQARLGAVDATVHQALAQKYQIQGYPTIKGALSVVFKTYQPIHSLTHSRLHYLRCSVEFGAKKNKPTDYRGGRTARDIVTYVKNSEEAKALGVRSASVTTLEFAHVHTFVTTHASVPTAIFFGSSNSAKKSKKKASGKVQQSIVWVS